MWPEPRRAAAAAAPPDARAPRVLALQLPELPLQRLRRSSDARASSIAILDEGRVVCCDGEARAAGVLPGMTAAQALGALGRLELVPLDAAGDRAALRALAEALLALAPAVEVSPPDALLLDASAAHVVSGLGAAAAGTERAERELAARALAVAGELGWSARAAVATGRAPARAILLGGRMKLAPPDPPLAPAQAHPPGPPETILLGGRMKLAPPDPPLAPAQAHPPGPPETILLGGRMKLASGPEIIWVADGAGREALAPLPLSALGLAPAVAARLAEVGVRDAGGLARLPEGTLAHRFGPAGVAAARLARGEDASPLVPYVPETLPEEALELEGPAESAEPLLFALKRLADRVAARLAGRGLGATRLRLVLKLDPRGEERIDAPLAQPTAVAARWLGPLKEHLFTLRLPAAVVGLRLLAVEVAPVAVEQLAFGDRPEAVAALEAVLARLAVRLGDGALFAAEPVARYRPEHAYRAVPFSSGPRRRGGAAEAELPEEAAHRPTRLLAVPELVVAEGEGGRLTALRVGGKDRAVLSWRGPERLAGEWWSERFDRDYYRVRLEGLGDCWLYRDGADGRLWLHGFFD